MKIVIMTTNVPNQVALCYKLIQEHEVAAIVLSRNKVARKSGGTLSRFPSKVPGAFFGLPFRKAWFSMLDRYRSKYPRLPKVPLFEVDNINQKYTLEIINRFQPQLVVVSGTNIIKKDLIDSIHQYGKVINLHTGISPYIKGGPNCTNWCLYEGNFHLIGNTVMWLDEGIDSGAIVTTEQTPLTGEESLIELHWQVMEHAHDLYLRSLRHLEKEGMIKGTLQGEICEGKTYFSRQWKVWAIIKAYLNFIFFYNEAYFKDKYGLHSKNLKLFPLRQKTS